ncbi:hypothetical protein WA577_003037 [Blastocystis sp. JDR]
MSQQLLRNSYKQLLRYAKQFDAQPILKFVLSDVIKSTATSSTPSLPKWFSNDLHILIPSLLQTNMTYYPSQSAVALLNRRFHPTAIPLDERKIASSSTKMIDFCTAVLRSSSTEYKVNLNRCEDLFSNASLAYQKDQDVYEKVKPYVVNLTTESQLKEGTILLNYPTTVLSRKHTLHLLDRDELLFVTRVNELGVQGVILNPRNVRVRTAGSTLLVTSRKPAEGRKQYITRSVEDLDFSSHTNGLHRIVGALHDPIAITAVPNGIPTTKEVVRFDSLECFTVDEMVQLITGGDMLMLRCENPLPLLFDSCCDGVE